MVLWGVEIKARQMVEIRVFIPHLMTLVTTSPENKTSIKGIITVIIRIGIR